MTEERNLYVSLEEAKEWYKSGNSAFKNLALRVYTKEELEASSYEQIMEEISFATACSCFTYPIIKEKTIEALNKLGNIAHFLNQGWKKEITGTGFFIAPSTESNHTAEGRKYEWSILEHKNNRYPGIIYFKSKDAALKALQIAYTECWLNDLE